MIGWHLAWLLAALLATAAAEEGPAPAPLERVAQVGERLRALAAAHPGQARVDELGRSLAGREILALRLGAPAEGPAPGVLVVAGLDGRRTGDTLAVLAAAERLAEGLDAAPLPAGTQIVLVPLASPDSAAALLGEDGPARERAGNGRADDADRDGRVDEDGPADLDGDGLVAWLRVPDPEGEWVPDEHDPRALRKARRERGERGTHRVLVEGRDADGDGEHAEDGVDGPQPDRNFPHAWKEYEPASGRVPLSEPESRALATFVQAHPELFAVLVVGAQDTLVDLPKGDAKAPSGWDAPLSALIDEDLAALKELQRRLRALPGGADHKVKGEGLSPGSFLAWSYHQAGRLPLALRLWEPPVELPKPEKGKDAAPPDAPAGDPPAAPPARAADEPASDPSSPVPAAVLAWLDREGLPGFLPWTPFRHPDLGEVELGGLRPGLLLSPPPRVAGEKAPLLAALLREVLDARPQLGWEDVRVERRADGIHELHAVLVDTGALPAFSALARSARTTRPLAVRLGLPDGGERLAGPQAPRVERLDGGGGREEFTWLVSGAPGARVVLSCDADALPACSREVTLP